MNSYLQLWQILLCVMFLPVGVVFEVDSISADEIISRRPEPILSGSSEKVKNCVRNTEFSVFKTYHVHAKLI